MSIENTPSKAPEDPGQAAPELERTKDVRTRSGSSQASAHGLGAKNIVWGNTMVPTTKVESDGRAFSMARQIARAAIDFENQSTGHMPRSVTVVLSDDTLVITLHGALSQTEKALVPSPDGAAHVQEFHRQLFANASDSLRQEIKRITGVVEVREAMAEGESATVPLVKVFTSGTVMQVYLLAQ
jgi:uncharacterized protein YbcI